MCIYSRNLGQGKSKAILRIVYAYIKRKQSLTYVSQKFALILQDFLDISHTLVDKMLWNLVSRLLVTETLQNII